MLSISDITLLSPPTSPLLASYTPAISLRNSGDILAYVFAVLTISVKDGAAVYTAQLMPAPIQPGATTTVAATRSWEPVLGQTYECTVSVFASNADAAFGARMDPVTIRAPSAAPEPGKTTVLYIQIPTGAKALVIQFDKDLPPSPVFGPLPFGRIMDPKDWP